MAIETTKTLNVATGNGHNKISKVWPLAMANGLLQLKQKI